MSHFVVERPPTSITTVRGAVGVEWLKGPRHCGCLHQHDTKLAMSKKEDDGQKSLDK
jgi:hypothetical protein